MLKFLCRHNKDYSRYNIIKALTKDLELSSDIYILMPFSKNQFIKNFFKRNRIINDFFISNYDTYIYDRQKIKKSNPRAWWKYFQDWINFRFSHYLLSDTQHHFEYWEKLFGKYKGKHFVLPVLADKEIYFPNQDAPVNQPIKILFYGSFIPLHGIDIILKAFKLLENKGLDFEANIIGTGQTYKKMLQLYQDLDLKNVYMNGQVIDEIKLANEIRNADIILGIFGNSQKALSVIPNKVYQALACQKPIITMETKAILEFFTENDLVFSKNSEESLAETIFDLSIDSNKRKVISENGYKSFIQLYDKTEKEFRSFIKSI